MGMSTDTGANQETVNESTWRRNHVSQYNNRVLLPAEVVLLARHREALSGRVLELGCGAGRVFGYLLELGGTVEGIDLEPSMIDYCHRVFPEANTRVGDLRDLDSYGEGPFDAIFGTNQIFDLLDPTDRQRILTGVRRLLAPGGLLLFSGHNLAHHDAPGTGSSVARARTALHAVADRPLGWTVRTALTTRRRMRNHKRLAPLESRAPDYAIVNDRAQNYGLLQYYTTRPHQLRQLRALGYEPIETLDYEGRRVLDGDEAPASPYLYYVARLAD